MEKEKDKKTNGHRKPVNFTGLQDIINNCIFKLAFLEDVFAGYDENAITKKGGVGLFLVLQDLGGDLNFVNNEMSERRDKGLIIEKKEEAI